MARTPDAPTHSGYSIFKCEEATIVDVNRRTWTVSVETTHSAKTVNDIQCLSPYLHYVGGAGVHHLPEVGAKCMIAWPSDNSPPFVLGYIGAARVIMSDDGGPLRSTADPEGSTDDVSFDSGRPELNPGDVALTTRDGNMVILRRGGVIQIGATPVAQRLYIPILNYIKDFCENYDLTTMGGELSWTVGRVEEDPGANAPVRYTLLVNEFAQDKKATVRISHFPLTGSSGEDKSAWEIVVSPQGISRDDGSVQNETYRLMINKDGKKVEFIGAGRTVTVKGSDELKVEGDRKVVVDGDETHDVGGGFSVKAKGDVTAVGRTVYLGADHARQPVVRGTELLKWIASEPFLSSTPGDPVKVNPSSAAKLKALLSDKVFIP